MPFVPEHIGALIEARLQVEEDRRQLQYARDALIGRNGFAVLLRDDNGFDIFPLGDAETVVREVPAGSPKPWESAYEQISGENWERLKAENRAARPPGDNPPIHQEGPRPTADALMLRKEAARADAIERNKRKTREELDYMKKYAQDAKAHGVGATPSIAQQQSLSQGPMTAAKMQAMNEEYRRKTA